MEQNSDYGLDLHSSLLLDEFRENLPVYQKIKEIAMKVLKDRIDEQGIYINATEARIKTESSLAGKLKLKGYKYNSVDDITDLVGLRVITFYTDEVDKIAALAEKTFEIDWENSVDKRKMHELDSFGYMSLHYICRIPESLYKDPECPRINQIRFELQMRTALQHVWATINHDNGYKTGVDVPREHLRNLTRLAGMLELADEQFSRIRTEINDYRRRVQALVADGDFDEVPLNGETFASYMKLEPFKKLADGIAAINQAEVYKDSTDPFLQIFQAMGMKTLGDVEKMKNECSDGAPQLTIHQIAGTDLDIIAQSVVLQNLCAVQILKLGWGEAGLVRLYGAFGGTEESNKVRAQRTLAQARKINIIK